MKTISRWKKIFLVLSFPFFCLQLTGCVYVVVGAACAVGGYAVTRDTIQGEYDARYSAATKAATDVCSMLGILTLKDTSRGLFEASINQVKVKIEITQLTPEAIRIKVKARKGMFPRLSVAEDVFVKIVQRIK